MMDRDITEYRQGNEQSGERKEDGILEQGNSGILRKHKHGKTNIIAGYSVLHLLVDGMCAMAMFGRFIPGNNGYIYILLYNFCAFALQMPMGVVLDALNGSRSERRDCALTTAALGVFCTILGAVTHPVILGCGNALFHIGGGVAVTKADRAKGVLPEEQLPGKWYGQGLGIFVAPGALGLYLGTLAAKMGVWETGFLCISAFMILLCAALWYMGKMCTKEEAERTSAGMGQLECARKESAEQGFARKEYAERGFARKESAEPESVRKVYAKPEVLPMFFCMAVVILRSHIGMTVGFSWKTGMTAGTLVVLAVVGGKMAGGFAAAKWGLYKTVVVSLALAALCYLFSAVMPFGLAATFLFNMTMPLTLYWMICRMPERPGCAFGFLTFALFLGFLPGYFGLVQTFAGNIAGCAGSILSMVLLAVIMGRKHGDSCG